MPSQEQVTSDIGSFIASVQKQCFELSVRLDQLTGPVGTSTSFIPGADVDMKGNDILNGGNASFQTVSYTGLNPPIDASTSYLLGAVENQVQPVAPAGLRDLWAFGSGVSANGGYLTYDPVRGIIWATDWAASKVNYSTNGGHTWTSCVFDVPLATPYTLGFSPSTVVIVPSYSAPGPIYTSSDGINFTAGATVAPCYSINVIWSAALGLFIAGLNSSVTSWIATSPTGAVWTSRTTPDFTGIANFTALAQSGLTNRIVMVGDSRVNPIYSDNGIVWNNASGSTGGAQAIVWSNERKEFVAGGVTSTIIRSTDGAIWTGLGSIGPDSSVAMIYVGGAIQRYYAARASLDGNIGLWSTADPALPWQFAELNGTQKINQSYGGLVYLPTTNSFVLGCDTVVSMYSTPKTGDIAAISGNIRVRGLPVHTDLWSSNGGFSVASTVVETAITSATTLGTLYVTPVIPIGMTLTETLLMSVTSAAGDTLTIRHKLAGTTFMTNTLTIPAAASGLTIKIITNAMIGSASATSFSTVAQGTTVATSTSSGAVTRTTGNLYSATAQWGAALSTCNILGMFIDVGFRNGA